MKYYSYSPNSSSQKNTISLLTTDANTEKIIEQKPHKNLQTELKKKGLPA